MNDSKTTNLTTKDFFNLMVKDSPSLTNVPQTQPVTTTKKSVKDLQLTDDFEPGEFDWLISDIFDKGRLHMIAGPQGSGKTRFFLRLINDWSNSIPVLGHSSYPSPFVYIDAARDKKSIKVALRSLGINPSEFNIIDWNAIHTSSNITDLLNRIPDDAEVIFIDNLSLMLTSDTHPDPSASITNVFKFLARIKKWMIDHNKTIIFTHTFVKTETSHKYASPRSKVYGAQAWLQSCETTILFDEENPQDLRDQYRLIDIIVKNYQPKDHQRRYKMQDDGRLVSAPKLPTDKLLKEEKVPEHLMLLSYFPKETIEITALELMKLTNLTLTTIYRYLKKLQQLGLIVKNEKTYSRV